MKLETGYSYLARIPVVSQVLIVYFAVSTVSCASLLDTHGLPGFVPVLTLVAKHVAS